jgi:hypothetical protein
VTIRHALADGVAPLLAAGFARLARRRAGEPVHHHGLALAGDLVLAPRVGPVGAALLDRPGRYRVRARLSWGLGGGRIPDVAGLAVRVLDAGGRGRPQDLLLDGSRPTPRDRVLVLRRDLAGWYGSPLRLRLGGPAGPKVQVTVRLEAGVPGRLTLAGARAAAVAGRLRGVLLVHDAGRLLATGQLCLDEVVRPGDPARPRFDVGVTGGGLVGTGFWQVLRQRAYAAARAADPRPAPRSLGRDEHPEDDVDHDLRARQQAGQQEEQPDPGR